MVGPNFWREKRTCEEIRKGIIRRRREQNGYTYLRKEKTRDNCEDNYVKPSKLETAKKMPSSLNGRYLGK